MSRSGDHRIRHLARWVATPTLALAAGLVVFAAYDGRPMALTGAAIAALVAGIFAVAVFDVELIRSRRAHGADRVAQARSYAAMYAAHVRVMAEGFALGDSYRRQAVAPVVDDPAYGRSGAATTSPVVPAVPAAAQPSIGTPARVEIAAPVRAVAEQETAAKPEPAVTAEPARELEPAGKLEPAAKVEPAGKRDEAAGKGDEAAGKRDEAAGKGDEAADHGAAATAAGSTRSAEGRTPSDASAVAGSDEDSTPEHEVREVAHADSPLPGKEIAAVAVPVAAAASRDAEGAVAARGDAESDGEGLELWKSVRDAPTVVDLMAWEVRARIAAEDERERAEAVAGEADGAAQAERAKVARTRKTRRRRGA